MDFLYEEKSQVPSYKTLSYFVLHGTNEKTTRKWFGISPDQ